MNENTKSDKTDAAIDADTEQKPPLFVNKTELDAETYLKASLRVMKTYRRGLLVCGIAVTAAGLLTLLLDTLYFHKKDGVLAWAMLLVGGMILACFFVIKPLLRKKIPSAIQALQYTLFTFYRDDFVFTSSLQENSFSNTRTQTGTYSMFVKCEEYPDFWILFYDKTNCEVIVKKYTCIGTAEALTEFLQTKLGDRYKRLYKQK